MRVIHVITRLIVGGAQENTIASVLGLHRKPPLQLNLVSGPTTGPEGSLESLLAGFPRLVTIIPELARPVHPWKDLVALRRLTRFFRENGPAIVHTHSGKAGILGRLAARRATVPVVIHTIHGPSFGSFQGWIANSAFRAAERYAARATTHFVTVADAMKQQYLAAGIGQPDRYSKIFSGFALAPLLTAKNDLDLRAKLGLAPGDVVVGTIARLFKLKGHEDLLAVAPTAVKSFPNLKFLLVGNGPWRSRLEKRVRSLGLERHFVFAGLVEPREVPRLIGIMDMLVHLSLREGLPRALPQALAASRPVIAYDCDGAREICFENETGFLLRPGDLAGLRERIIFLARDAGLRERLGRSGQDFVRARFSVERMVDDLYQLYMRLAQTAGVLSPPRA